MESTELREQLAAWLHRRGVDDVTFVETHVSVLAFGNDRVWKCRKHVHLAFADFSTMELRAADCRRELALNRRLAPDVYLRVCEIDDKDGRVVDYAVEMLRLPDDRRLASIATQRDREADGQGDGDGVRCVERVATLVADFHSRAATGGDIDRAATAEAIGRLWTANFDELYPFVGRVLDEHTFDAVRRDATQYVAGRDALFAGRVTAGHIRDGHGDLLADDIFCLDDGPRVLDCLEFDDHFRYGDVVADLAFLAMDLEHLGRPDLATVLFDRYRHTTGNDWPRSLEHHYVAYRALVRAKVACLRAPDDESAPARARSLLDLCARHLASARVRLVLVGGPPATGKTTMANALGGRTRWPVVHSDEVRKRLAGIEPTTAAGAPVDTGLYTPAMTDRTYAALLDAAREHLVQGRSVIVDASWTEAPRRRTAADLARDTHSEYLAVQCDAPVEIAAARATARAEHRGVDASDATAPIARELASRFERWPEATVLHTTAPVRDGVEQVIRAFNLPTDGPLE